MDKTIYYRGQTKNFSGNVNNGLDIVPSILRDKQDRFSLIEEANYYKNIALQMKEVYDVEFGSDGIINAKVLSLFQHQGFLTRLIDITTSYDIALYFASNGYFNENGYVYRIVQNKSIKEIKDKLSLSVTRKINTIINSEKLIRENTNLIDYFKSIENISSININTIKNAVILDYNKIYTNRDLKNLRLNKQKGSFILLGNEVSDDFRLTGNINRKVFDNLDDPIIIKKEKKLDNLFNLTLKGINYVSLFPDADISKCLVSKFNEMSKLNNIISLKKLINSSFVTKKNENSMFTYFRDYLLKHIDELKLDFMQNENKFYFVFKELVDYFKYHYDFYLDEFGYINYEEVIDNIINSVIMIKDIA